MNNDVGEIQIRCINKFFTGIARDAHLKSAIHYKALEIGKEP